MNEIRKAAAASPASASRISFLSVPLLYYSTSKKHPTAWNPEAAGNERCKDKHYFRYLQTFLDVFCIYRALLMNN